MIITSPTFLGRNDSQILKVLLPFPVGPLQPRLATFRVTFLIIRAIFKPTCGIFETNWLCGDLLGGAELYEDKPCVPSLKGITYKTYQTLNLFRKTLGKEVVVKAQPNLTQTGGNSVRRYHTLFYSITASRLDYKQTGNLRAYTAIKKHVNKGPRTFSWNTCKFFKLRS